jgi:hypothetical protein
MATGKRPKRTRGRPPTGRAMTAAERMRRFRERRRAAGLTPVVSWVAKTEQEPLATYSSHRLLDARSLAMHAVIARKIERDPALLAIAHRNLERWSAQRPREAPRWLKEWRSVLKQPWPSIAALITDPGERATRLRQSSPFAGVLTPAERWRIHEAFRA